MPYIGNDIQYGELNSQTFTGDGSTTAFTLTYTVSNVNSLLVTVADVIQEPTTAYTVSGTTLTFTSAPANLDTIHVRYLGRTLDVGTTAIVQDSDQDTKIQVEESADEDTIRFDTGGTERVTINSTSLTSTTPLYIPDGSNSAPSITNTGDTDTGIYFSADNEISTATAGEQRIILDSSGVLKPREASTYGGAGAVIQGAVVFACEMPYVSSVADNTWVQISMSTPVYENKAIVDGTTTGNAITIKKAGKYMMVWNGTLGGGASYGNGTYHVRLYVEKNSVTFGGGTALFGQGASENGTPAGNGLTQYASSARGGVVSGIESLSVSDVIRFWQLHDHSGSGYANPGNVMLIYFDE